MGKIKVFKGDITKLHVDAIVNAANSGLRGGGGVDGAIHRAGGPTIMKECRKIGGCPTGEAVITTAGKLPSKYVIHTVGPVWSGGNQNEVNLLVNAYQNSLRLAKENLIPSIAFPNISTGVYGFPKQKAAKIALNTCREFIKSHESDMEITFVCFDEENFHLYLDLISPH
jgi:O-acetyl-ADP-ribose deacetylase (regulator of RNase III)